MTNGITNIFLGVGPAIYSDPILAADALMAAPLEQLGAELIPLADAFRSSDQEMGFWFLVGFRSYKDHLLTGNLEEAGEMQNLMAKSLWSLTTEKWQKLLAQVEKCRWAFSAGFFTTPSLLAPILEIKPDVVIAKDMETIQTILSQELDKALTSDVYKQLTIVYDGVWPAVPSLHLPVPLLKKAQRRLGRTPLLYVHVPLEKRLYGIYPYHQRDGAWGLYYFSATTEAMQAMSDWEAGHVTQQGFDIEGFSTVHHGNNFPDRAFSPDILKQWRAVPRSDIQPIWRQMIERKLLQLPENEPFCIRMQQHPALKKWLRLKALWGTIETETETIKNRTKEMIDGFMASLGRLTVITEEGVGREFRHLIENFGWKNIWGLPGSPLTDAKAKRLANLIEHWKHKKMISETEAFEHLINLLWALTLSKDYFRLAQTAADNKTLLYKIALWQRDPWFDGVLALDSKVYEDLSVQFLTVKAPNGDILGGGAMLRLVLDPEEKLHLIYSAFQTRANHNHWITPEMETFHREAIERIGEELGIPRERIQKVDNVLNANWVNGFVPVSAPLESDQATKVAREWSHPHAALFGPSSAKYDALKIVPNAVMRVTNPWVGLDGGLDTFFLREIDPNPDPLMADDYFYGFSARRGRAVNYHIDYTGPDSTHWYFLSDVAVGRTAFARGGAENRDGLSGMDEIMTRYYLTNLMHAVAGPYGFRTSLGIAVVDRQKEREGHIRISGLPQEQASIFELAREELRPDDLLHVVLVEETIDVVKQRIAEELKRPTLTNAEYIQWLATTIGEQLALMHFFGFDHGVAGDNKDPQLHSGNITLAGEIRDHETARFRPKDSPDPIHLEALKTRYLYENEMSLDGIQKAQSADQVTWLKKLLSLTPTPTDFHGMVLYGYTSKLEWLEKSGINPAQEIRRFNVEKWNPAMRSLRNNNFSAVPIYPIV